MEVIETNASRAYFDDIPLGPVGFQVNMLRSASGRAYIAASPPAVRDAVLETLRRSTRPGDRLSHSPEYVARMIEETETQGFALRDPDFGGNFDEGRGAVDDGRESLGVAIRLGNHVAGTINITWTRRAHKRDVGAMLFADAAIRAAEAVSEALSKGKGFTK
jgi:IclR family mhp operon transcriptional activator